MSQTESKDKILLIEPDDDVRSMLEIYFTYSGYEVVTKTDENYALLMLQYYRPDVVLLAQPGKEYTNHGYMAVPTNDYVPILQQCRQNNIPLIVLIDTPYNYEKIWDGSFFR